MKILRHILIAASAALSLALLTRCGDPDIEIPAGDPTEDPGGTGNPGEPEKPVVNKEGSIPLLYINTGGKNIPKSDYIDATMRLLNPDGVYSNQLDETFTIEIHGRGNSTWGMPKKPYKIKLAKKNRLLGMSDNKHWVLLANYSDKSLLRNALAFRLSEAAGMAWAVRWRPVEVYINGSYQGVYQLAEHVRVGDERVELDVVGTSDNSGDAVTGGYFLWIDGRSRDESNGVGFRTPRGLPVTIEDPETPTAAQLNYIRKFMEQTELDLYNLPYRDLGKIIDIDSFIRYFFVQELGKNVDGNMRLSTYMWKPRNGKLGFPCVWDFDLAFGNCNYMHEVGATNAPDGWHIRNAIWFRQLFRQQEFCDRVAAMWNEFYPKLAGVETEMRQWAARMDDAQKRNFQRWTILNTHVWPNLVVKGSYQGELNYMLDFFMTRAAWMNTEIQAGRLRKLD